MKYILASIINHRLIYIYIYNLHYYIAANILGHDESPPPYSVQGPDHADRFGVNFAVAGSGASGQTRLPLLGLQIDAFNSLVTRGIIDLEDSSVALIAISGNLDYASITHTSSFSDVSN
jgi:hypothetical protein